MYDNYNDRTTKEDLQVAIEEVEDCFFFATFADYYMIINNTYNEFNFQDKMADSERIAEYKYIYEQLLKYVHKAEPKVMGDLSDNSCSVMKKEAYELRKKTDKSTDRRAELVYQRLRNSWLDELIYKTTEALDIYNHLDK